MEENCVSIKEFNEKIKLVEKLCNSFVDNGYFEHRLYYRGYFNYIYNNLSTNEIKSCLRNNYHIYDVDDWIVLKKIFTKDMSHKDAMKISGILYKYDTSISDGDFEYNDSDVMTVGEEASLAWDRKKNEK